jgi:AI-2 transport system permease protein
MGFSAAMLGVACSPDRWGLPPPVGVLICLCCGLAVGLFNGVLVGILKVPSIVVTLGTATILQGATEVAMGGRWITDLPPSLRALGTGSWLGLPFVFLVALVIGFLGWWTLHHSPLGCRLRALGGDPGHAKLVGLPITRLQILVFVGVGLAAAMAAAFSSTQLQVIESGFGRGFELAVIAAVVVGGVSIRGGSGSMVGAWLGVALLGTLSTILIFLKLGDSAVYWERATQGLVILLAVGLEFKRRRLRSS